MSHGPTIALVLGFLAFIGFVFVTLSNEWKRSSKIDTEDHLNNIFSSEGLWVRCSTMEAGKYTCDSYETNIIGLPAHITGLRAMMIISLIAGCGSVVLIILALSCVHATEGALKRRMSQFGGLLLLLASVLCIAAVSWYAWIVITEYYNAKLTGVAQLFYEFGAAIYVGWVAGGIGVVGAIIAVCGAPYPEEDSDYRYDYQPSKTKSATEYV